MVASIRFSLPLYQRSPSHCQNCQNDEAHSYELLHQEIHLRVSSTTVTGGKIPAGSPGMKCRHGHWFDGEDSKVHENGCCHEVAVGHAVLLRRHQSGLVGSNVTLIGIMR
jgi:hypothetical protein